VAVALAVQWIANYLVNWTFPMLDSNPTLVSHFNHGLDIWRNEHSRRVVHVENGA